MKRIGLVTLLLLPLACSNHDHPTQAQVSADKIAALEIDAGGLRFTAETPRGRRFVRVQPEGTRIRSRLEDASGRLLFGVAAEFDGRSMIVVESTEKDELRIERSYSAGDVHERLRLNGRELAVTYPQLDYRTMEKFREQYRRGDFARIPPRLLDAFRAFEEFYDAAQTLHWNPEGETLIATLLSRDLAERIRSALAEQPSIHRRLGSRRDFSVHCAFVGIGTGLKCFFGGAGNPICLIGAYYSIGCGILELGCSLWWNC